MMSRLPWLNRHYRYQRPPPPPPPIGRFNSPPPPPPPVLPTPPGFRPFFAPISPLYFRPSRVTVPLQYLPNEFYRRYINRMAGNWSPVAGRRRRHPRTSRRRRISSSASQPPHRRSPGRTPTSRTPDVQEVRQEQVTHLRQACHSQPQAEITNDDTFSVDDASRTEEEGVRPRKLQKPVSHEKSEPEVLAVADDQESTRGKEKVERQTDQISTSGYACSTAGDGSYGEAKLQEFLTSDGIEFEDSSVAVIQEATQAQASNQTLASPRKAKRQKDQIYTMEEDGSSTSEGGEMRERKLLKLVSPEKNELEAPTIVPIISQTAQMTSSFHDQADSFSLTANTFDDVSSTGDTMVRVGNYSVDQKHSATMNAIIEKYGDIAKDCRNPSDMFRSYAVQGVCEVVQGLRIPLKQLSHGRLKTYTCFVKEALVMGLSVQWLQERLDDVSETIESMKEYKKMRDARRAIMEKMEDLEKTRRLMETEKRKCEDEVEKAKGLFEDAMLEVKKKKSAIDDIKSRWKAIPKRLLDGLY